MSAVNVAFVCLLIGYLIGSILFAQLITKIVTGKEIREMGNGNPGAYNVFRHVGKGWGVLAGLLDAIKALAPMLIASHYWGLSNVALGCLGIGAVLGHAYPLYYRFRGGRAASVMMGMYLFFIPYELVASLIIVAVILLGFIKKEYGVWGPSGILALSWISCLFLPHPAAVKLVITLGAVLMIFLNRDAITKRFNSQKEPNKKI
jgi:glycerol-3-phosphate acyltransferase PlsY